MGLAEPADAAHGCFALLNCEKSHNSRRHPPRRHRRCTTDSNQPRHSGRRAERVNWESIMPSVAEYGFRVRHFMASPENAGGGYHVFCTQNWYMPEKVSGYFVSNSFQRSRSVEDQPAAENSAR